MIIIPMGSKCMLKQKKLPNIRQMAEVKVVMRSLKTYWSMLNMNVSAAKQEESPYWLNF